MDSVECPLPREHTSPLLSREEKEPAVEGGSRQDIPLQQERETVGVYKYFHKNMFHIYNVIKYMFHVEKRFNKSVPTISPSALHCNGTELALGCKIQYSVNNIKLIGNFKAQNSEILKLSNFAAMVNV